MVPPSTTEVIAAQQQAILNAVGDRLPGDDREPVEIIDYKSLATHGLISRRPRYDRIARPYIFE
jgi:hypothetical protein